MMYNWFIYTTYTDFQAAWKQTTTIMNLEWIMNNNLITVEVETDNDPQTSHDADGSIEAQVDIDLDTSRD